MCKFLAVINSSGFPDYLREVVAMHVNIVLLDNYNCVKHKLTFNSDLKMCNKFYSS